MAPTSGPSDNKVKVSIRVRPLIQREKEEEEPISWMCYGNVIQQLQPGTSSVNSASLPYSFDHIFNQEADTKEIYEKVVQPIVQNSFQGFNGAVLCYGQTSSGKTYTLYGSDEEPGIIYLVAEDLFKRITEDSSRQYYIRVGLLEVYNEKVLDLLAPGDKKQVDIVISKDQNSVMPKDLTELEVFTAEDMLNAAKHVQKARRIGETKMNKDSSRSHTIVRIIVESVEKNEEVDPKDREVISACLNLVDLAGSEKASQTGAVGDRLKEATYINKSLSSLAQVVLQLSQASGATISHNTSAGSHSSVSAKQSSKYVSFRDSKLTRLLQSSLEGNAFISLICNVTPASVEETHSTLRFARTAKLIKVDPTKNLRSVSDCKQYKTKISELENLLNDKASEVDKLKQQLLKLQKFHPFSNVLVPKNFEAPDRRKTMCPSMLQWDRNASQRFSATVQSEFKHPSSVLSLNRSVLTLTSTTSNEVYHDAADIFDQQPSISKKRRLEDRIDVVKVDAQTETDGLDLQPLNSLRQQDMNIMLEVLNQRKLENTETINELCTEKSFLQHEYELVKEDLQVEIDSLKKTNAALIAANERMKLKIVEAPSNDEIERLRESNKERHDLLALKQKEIDQWKETAEDSTRRLAATTTELEVLQLENRRLCNENGSLKQSLEESTSAHAATMSARTTMCEELEAARNELQNQEAILNNMESKFLESDKEASYLQEILSSVQEELKNATSQIEEMNVLKKKNEGLENNSSLAAEKFEAQTQQLAQLQKDYEENKAVHSELIQNYDRISGEKASLELQIQHLQKKVEEAENDEHRSAAKFTELQHEICSLKRALEESASAHAAIVLEKSVVSEELASARTELENHEDSLKKLEMNLLESQKEALDLTAKLLSAKEELENANSQIKETIALKEKIEEFEKNSLLSAEKFEAQTQELALLETAYEEKKNVHSELVTEFNRISEEKVSLEIQIQILQKQIEEAAFTEERDGAKFSELQTVINSLKQSLEESTSAHANTLIMKSNVCEELVAVRTELKNQEDCLIDMESKLLESQKEASCLKEAFSSAKEELKNVTSQIEEMNELKKKNEEHEKYISLATEKFEAQTQKLQELEKAYEEKKSVHSELVQDYDRIFGEKASLEFQIQNLQKQIEQTENDEQRSAAKFTELQHEICSLKRALEESASAHAAIVLEKSVVSEELASARTELENHKDSLSKLEMNLLESQKETSHLKAKLSLAQEQLNNATSQIDEINALKKKNEDFENYFLLAAEKCEAQTQHLAQLQKDYEENKAVHSELMQNYDRISGEKASLELQIQNLQKKVEEAENDEHRGTSNVPELQNEICSLKRALEESASAHTAIVLEKSVVSEELASARTELENHEDSLKKLEMNLLESQKEALDLTAKLLSAKEELANANSQIKETIALKEKIEEFEKNSLLSAEKFEAQTQELALLETAYEEKKNVHSELVTEFNRISEEKVSLEIQIHILQKQIEEAQHDEQRGYEEIRELQNEICSLKQSLEESTSAHAVTTLEKTVVSVELASTRTELEAHKTSLDNLETNLLESRKEALDLKENLSSVKEELKNALSQIEEMSDLKKKNEDYENNILLALEKLQAQTEQLALLEKVYDEMKTVHSELVQDYDRISGEKSSLELQMQILRTQTEDTEICQQQVTNLKTEICTLKLALEQSTLAHGAIVSEKSVMAEELASTRTELENHKDSLIKLEANLLETRKETLNLRENLSSAKEELKSSALQIEEMNALKTKNQDYENYFLLAAEKFEAQTQQLSQLEKAYEEKKLLHSELVQDYDRVSAEKASLELQVQFLQKRIEEAEMEEQQGTARIAELQNEICSLKRTLEESVSAHAAISLEKSAVSEELASARTMLENHEAILNSLESNLMEFRNEAVELKDALTESRKRFEAAQMNYDAALAEKQDLLDQKLVAMQELKQAKEQLEVEMKVHQNCNNVIKELQSKISELDEEKENCLNVKVKKRSVGIQSGATVDIMEKVRYFEVETHRLKKKYSELSQNSQKKILTQSEEIKDLTKKLNECEPKITTLEDALGKCLLELDGYKAILPVEKVSAEVQCDTMKDSLHRLLLGQRATLPKGYPDVYSVVKDYEKVRGEVAILESWKRRCECNKKRGQLGYVSRIGVLSKPLSNQRSGEQVSSVGRSEPQLSTECSSYPNVGETRSAAASTDPSASPAAKFGVNLRPTGATPISDRVTRQTAALHGRDIFKPPSVISRPTALPSGTKESNTNTEQEDDDMTEIERLTLAYISS